MQTAAYLCKLYLDHIRKWPYMRRIAPGTKATIFGHGEFEIVKQHANGDCLMKDAKGQQFYSRHMAYV
jgi:hypothetical protein